MRVFVTGATGFIGSAIVRELMTHGHSVLGLARSDAGAAAVAATGAEVLRGDLTDLDSLRGGAGQCDGVIHTAFIHDFSNIAASGVVDLAAVTAMGEALKGSDRPLIVTSGTAHVATGRLATEDLMPDARAVIRHRIPSEIETLKLADSGVRAMVMRLPPSVHGEGDHGFVPELIRVARGTGVSAYVGDGKNRWPAVHRLDAATLFRLAVEKGEAGAIYHGVGEEGVATRDIAAVIGKQLGMPVVSKTAENAPAHFGWIGAFFAWDCPASSALTQERLGWHPVMPALIPDLEQGHYFRETLPV
jgi:nucleoside-diphosphate-sugar epimerase